MTGAVTQQSASTTEIGRRAREASQFAGDAGVNIREVADASVENVVPARGVRDTTQAIRQNTDALRAAILHFLAEIKGA